jgi:hypothetical protein
LFNFRDFVHRKSWIKQGMVMDSLDNACSGCACAALAAALVGRCRPAL